MKFFSKTNMSIVTVCLMGVSAVTAAIVPSAKSEDEDLAFAQQGVSVLSSSGDGGRTAIAGLGDDSYTKTGLAAQGFSATSADNNGTLTVGIGQNTQDSTTHGDWN